MNRLFKSTVLAGVVGAGLLALGAGGARADIFPTLKTITPLGGGLYRWTYDATLNDTEKVVGGDLSHGDFFTIYDFAGLVPGMDTEPAGWTFTSALLGKNGSFVMPTSDNGGIPNLTWTYTPTGMQPAEIDGPTDLGLFSAVSIYSSPVVSDFTSQATEQFNQPGLPAGSKADNIGWIPTPVVPEPCTMALLGFGAAPLLGGLRRRSRKA